MTVSHSLPMGQTSTLSDTGVIRQKSSCGVNRCIGKNDLYQVLSSIAQRRNEILTSMRRVRANLHTKAGGCDVPLSNRKINLFGGTSIHHHLILRRRKSNERWKFRLFLLSVKCPCRRF